MDWRPALLGSFLCAAGVVRAQEPVAAQIDELLRHKDDAPVELVDRIAASRTREAALGLAKALDGVGSLRLRREIVRALGQFATVPEAEQPALQKLADVAGTEEEEELRLEALAGLGRSATIGKALLQKLVDAELPDVVREPALARHVELASQADAEWYRRIWNLEQQQRKDAKGNLQAPELNSIRLLAFRGLLPWLGEDELVATLKREIQPKIRRLALLRLHQQAMPRATEMAAWVLDRVDFPGADRAEAARILVDRTGAKVVPTFLDLMRKRDVTPDDLREAMARLLAELGDEATDKRLAKLIGRGKPHEQVFVLLATARNQDPKFLAAVRKGLVDEAKEVRRATAAVLGERRDREALPELRAMLQKPRDPEDVRLALEAITAIEGFSSAWLRELGGYAGHADRDVRNTAIEAIGRARDRRQLDVLVAALAHADWSTRLSAVEALQSLQHKDGVAALVGRLGAENGRLRRRIAEALWRLTAQPFGEDPAAWLAWWEAAGSSFQVASEKELDRAERERERRRLDARTAASPKFFGLRVESRRVVFVVDVSGSMLESMYGRYVGRRGATRIDVARQELRRAIERLEPGTLFNVMAFASSVACWRKEGVAVCDAATRASALEWVDRLGAAGATNLFDSLQLAFADPDVDTIYVMSDGEPTNGAIVDPHRIRREVASWNKHRKIVLHAIAIGGNLEVLEWLAKDAGGTYVQMR
ncbi:MAG: HEAT repeat domain-containing protein [Planctomycetes bacterium]|nr:HEAT repeat domain-containing protein [Planctomycetota bacterium]